MLNAIYATLWLFALWKWGDWKNWERYYPTILFFIIVDFLYLYLLSDAYPMWRYDPPTIDEEMNVTNSHVAFSVMLVKYPATVLIFLSMEFWWSCLFNLVVFSILRVHYTRPPLASLLSIGFMMILWNIFNVPSNVFR